jgi:hypothetical protein
MKDTCRLAEAVSSGYGDETATILTDIDCLFLQSTSNSHSGNVDVIGADAHIYLDIENPVLMERGYRIEGLYVIVNPFGADDDESWYRISRVVVGQRKLLDNDVDNVHAYLRKVAKKEVGNVS